MSNLIAFSNSANKTHKIGELAKEFEFKMVQKINSVPFVKNIALHKTDHEDSEMIIYFSDEFEYNFKEILQHIPNEKYRLKFAHTNFTMQSVQFILTYKRST